jgi:hypothetical protein
MQWSNFIPETEEVKDHENRTGAIMRARVITD